MPFFYCVAAKDRRRPCEVLLVRLVKSFSISPQNILLLLFGCSPLRFICDGISGISRVGLP